MYTTFIKKIVLVFFFFLFGFILFTSFVYPGETGKTGIGMKETNAFFSTISNRIASENNAIDKKEDSPNSSSSISNIFENTDELIPSGSYIIDMGVMPQTVGNALKPYGLIWELLENHLVPIKWAIQSGKNKDGIDFTYNGMNFRGGPFIILAEYRTPTVNAVISEWENKGVVGVSTSSDFFAPIERTINYSMNWTLDQENGHIAEDYLITAGIPGYAYNWVLPNNLNCCVDVFLMPHAGIPIIDYYPGMIILPMAVVMVLFGRVVKQ